MEHFVKATEIWVPGTGSPDLELSTAFYGDLEDFKLTSQDMRFAYNQGLPGKTWAAGHPLVLTSFHNSYFQRVTAADKAGITCGISFPIFCGEFLQAVVVLFCGGGKSVVGAMEVWKNKTASELTLVDGYYGELERFEWVSRRLSIMKGRGLPGSSWKQDRPIIIDDIGHSNSFLRARNAAEVGITTGLAIPFSNNGNGVYILNFLSAKGTPIARRFEIWMVDTEQKVLKFDSGQCASGADLEQKYAGVGLSKSEGPLGQAWLTGRPLVTEINAEDGNVMIVLPITKGCSLDSIVCIVL